MLKKQLSIFSGSRPAVAGVFAMIAVTVPAGAQPPAPAPVSPPAAVAPSEVPPPPPAPPVNTGSVKFGKETKITLGKVIDVEKADNGCLINFKSEKGDEFIELGMPKFCTLKPSLKGRQIEMEYRLETVLANECVGNPKCKKTESLPVIVEVKVLN
jgi:hypothetical protein